MLTTSATSEGGAASIKGDASDTFAFAYFWPDIVHAPIAKVCDAIWDLLVALRVCTPFTAEDVDAGNEQAVARGEGGLPSLLTSGGGGGGSGGRGRGGGRREEAERRRALALRALDSRLHAASVRPPPVAHVGPNPLGETEYTPDPGMQMGKPPRPETEPTEGNEQR